MSITTLVVLLLVAHAYGDQKVCIDHLRKFMIQDSLTDSDITKPIKLAANDTCSQIGLNDVMGNFVDNLRKNLPVSKQSTFLSILSSLDKCLKSKNSSLEKLKSHVNKYILDVYKSSYDTIRKYASSKKCSDYTVVNKVCDKFQSTTTFKQYEDLCKRINYKKGEYYCLKDNLKKFLKFPTTVK